MIGKHIEKKPENVGHNRNTHNFCVIISVIVNNKRVRNVLFYHKSIIKYFSGNIGCLYLNQYRKIKGDKIRDFDRMLKNNIILMDYSSTSVNRLLKPL